MKSPAMPSRRIISTMSALTTKRGGGSIYRWLVRNKQHTAVGVLGVLCYSNGCLMWLECFSNGFAGASVCAWVDSWLQQHLAPQFPKPRCKSMASSPLQPRLNPLHCHTAKARTATQKHRRTCFCSSSACTCASLYCSSRSSTSFFSFWLSLDTLQECGAGTGREHIQWTEQGCSW